MMELLKSYQGRGPGLQELGGSCDESEAWDALDSPLLPSLTSLPWQWGWQGQAS